MTDPLPRWDMSNVYPGLESPEYQQAVEQLAQGLEHLHREFDSRGISAAGGRGPGSASTLAWALQQLNQLELLAQTLEAYAFAHLSTDSTSPVAQREVSRLDQMAPRRRQLRVRLMGWLGRHAGELNSWLGHPDVAPCEFFLRQAVQEAQHLMAEPLEELAGRLCVDGAVAFGRLQGDLTSQLTVDWDTPEGPQRLPVTRIHNFAYSADGQLRRRAYEAELKAWAEVEVPVAAALNSVKGTALTLAQARRWPSVLHEALFRNRISESVLKALMDSIKQRFEVFRRYLRAKARVLGQEVLPWWDLFAPLGRVRRFSWQEAQQFLEQHFARFSEQLAQLAHTAFQRRWIDAQVRQGKRAGAFCMEVPAVEESRILINYDGSFQQLATLAHELGHAFHNHCQRGLLPLQRENPMTLAETASTFCETLITEAVLQQAEPEEQLAVLDVALSSATQVCLDISCRFRFEQEFLRRRTQRQLDPQEISQLMLQAQAQTYADSVDAKTYHRYMWVWKPHYYDFQGNFYNFPYAFGHLFAVGLYVRWTEQGEGFVDQYCQLLRDTGRADAAQLAKRFGIQLEDPQFWHSGLNFIERQVEQLEQLVKKIAG